MSGLLKLFGLVLLVAAIIFAVMLKLSSAQMQVMGISPDVIATLLVGGILGLGLGGILEALKTSGVPSRAATSYTEAAPAEEIVEEKTATLPNVGFGKKRFETKTETEKVPEVLAPVGKAVAVGSVAETIAALEQAKSDIKTALGGVESISEPAEIEAPVKAAAVEIAAEPEAEPVAAGDELFVVEEKIIRGRPSRILSDDTVEAETDEGWMRFENLEHLNEYLDSMEEDNA